MAPAARVRVGTAGWAYEDWNGIVYPQKPGRGFDKLGLMASLFDTNEINSTFYRTPDPRMTRDWARRVAHNPRFAFTAKLFRGFTHERKADEEDRKSVLQALEPLAAAGRLGCVLVQFPISFHDTPENRAYLEKLLSKFPDLPLAVEFRHAEWDSADTLAILERRGAAFVNIDQPWLEGNLRATEHAGGRVAYFRFHGRNAAKWFGPDTSNEQRYNYLYSGKELEPWADRIERTRSRLDAGESPADGVYAILNNHFRGQAVANAIELQNRLTGRAETVPETLFQAYPGLAAVARVPAAKQRTLF